MENQNQQLPPPQKPNLMGRIKSNKTAVLSLLFIVILAAVVFFMYKRCKKFLNVQKGGSTKVKKNKKNKKESFNQDQSINEGFDEQIEENNSINLNE